MNFSAFSLNDLKVKQVQVLSGVEFLIMLTMFMDLRMSELGVVISQGDLIEHPSRLAAPSGE